MQSLKSQDVSNKLSHEGKGTTRRGGNDQENRKREGLYVRSAHQGWMKRTVRRPSVRTAEKKTKIENHQGNAIREDRKEKSKTYHDLEESTSAQNVRDHGREPVTGNAEKTQEERRKWKKKKTNPDNGEEEISTAPRS